MLGEQHAFGGKPVDIGRAELLLSQAAQITVAKVVCDKINDVGKGVLRVSLLAPEQTGKHEYV
jgi:hypothetical protein